MIEFYETSMDLETKKKADMEVVLLGYEDCVPGHAYGPTLRPYQLLHFVTKGEGSLRIQKQTYSLRAGDLFLIPEGQISYYEASARNPWSYAWAGFTGLRSDAVVRQFLEAAPERYVLRGVDTEKYAARIRPAAGLTQGGEAACFYMNSVLFALISWLLTDLPEHAQYSPSLAERVKFYIDAKFAEKIQVQSLAERFGVHPNYLTRVFREKYGVSPKKYLTDLKMQRAAYMLSTTQLPVALIAAALGFEDPLAFSKAYRCAWGESPAVWRKKQEAAGSAGGTDFL